jgi:CRP-like cAMP-binding protein
VQATMPFADRTFYGCFRTAPIFADKLFERLSPTAHHSLNSIKQKKLFRGDITVAENGVAPNIYLLVKGRAKRVGLNCIDNRRISNFVFENEVFGLTETISNSRSRYKLNTITPCVFEFIKREDFMNFLNQQPEVGENLAKILSFDLNSSYQTFSTSTF